MRTQLLVLAASLAAFTPACGSLDASESDDAELAGEGDGKADAGSSTSTFYSLRRDLRRCVAPLCGGYWVKRVNFSTTRCLTGGYQSECYVAETDLSALGLSDAEQNRLLETELVLRGTLAGKTFGSFGKVAIFAATEAWQPATGTAPSGTFYRVSDLGIKCFAYPCAGQHEAKLNSTISADIAGFELSGTDATVEQQYDANVEVFGGQPILVAGSNTTVTGPGGSARQLVATQFYTRVKHQVPVGPASCGGLAGNPCAAGEYCDLTVANACHGADLSGVCKTVPQFCTRIYQPVCGCDGKTYGNDCERLGSQVQLDHVGTCP